MFFFILGSCLTAYINIPNAVAFPSQHKYSGFCGEAWAHDAGTVGLGPIRCKMIASL